MSSLKTLTHLLILVAFATSQPAHLLRQACVLVQVAVHMRY